MPRIIEVDCCVVGGGPAGVMAGLLFARAGVRTIVLEKHGDFLRDFRGDTVHPSTLQLMHELGLLEALLSRPHQRMSRLSGVFGGRKLDITDFASLPVAAKFIAFMPQWHFLDFLTEVGSRLPTFAVEMRAEATGLIGDGGRIGGVRVKSGGGDDALEVRARLTIGADGRGSVIREAAGLVVDDIGAPIDVLWFRVPRDSDTPDDEPLLNAGPGHIVITIDRGDYYQCALVIPKGEAERVLARGLDNFRQTASATAPRLEPHIASLASLDDVKLLTVKIDRLRNWSRPGLVMIGDAAHAMSPIGGVGINLAVQDAVAAANLLAGPLASGSLEDGMLDGVRRRRLWPVRATQMLQVAIQKRIVVPLLSAQGPGQSPSPPLPLRIVAACPFLQRRVASLIGLGVRPEHISSPEALEVTAQRQKQA